jgi:hypothetical protein
MVKKTTETTASTISEANVTANDMARFAGGIKDTVLVESMLPLSDINMHKYEFEGREPGIYKIDYRCPRYNMMLTVSWDGENLV